MTQKSILIGLGNPIASDDAIGVIVAKRLAERLPDFDFEVGSTGGFDLVDRILGYKRAVVIDAMITGRFRVGVVRRVDLSCCDCLLSISSHGIGIEQAIEFARRVGASIPDEIIIYGIEIGDPKPFGDGISKELVGCIDSIVNEIASDLLGRESSCTN